jgi:hypothetical protein
MRALLYHIRFVSIDVKRAARNFAYSAKTIVLRPEPSSRIRVQSERSSNTTRRSKTRSLWLPNPRPEDCAVRSISLARRELCLLCREDSAHAVRPLRRCFGETDSACSSRSSAVGPCNWANLPDGGRRRRRGRARLGADDPLEPRRSSSFPLRSEQARL